jgi:hypothetical protein
VRKLGSLLAAVLIATALMQGTASARDIQWCAEDPIIELLGAQFRLTANINLPASAVSGISYVITVPENAGEVKVTFPPGDVLAAITSVTIQRTGEAFDADDDEFEVRVALTVSSAEKAKVVVVLDGRSVDDESFNGRTNKTLKFGFDVKP